MDEVKRGHVYRYKESEDGAPRSALVISANERGRDRYVSILFITDSFLGHDVIKLSVNGVPKCVHCGMITYTQRENLTSEVCKVPEHTMHRIDGIILHELGIKHDAEAELAIYKDLYDQLVDAVGDIVKEKGE